MCNMTALSLVVRKLWPRLKFFNSRSNFKVKVTRSNITVPCERSCHKEYTFIIMLTTIPFCVSEPKCWRTDRQTDLIPVEHQSRGGAQCLTKLQEYFNSTVNTVNFWRIRHIEKGEKQWIYLADNCRHTNFALIYIHSNINLREEVSSALPVLLPGSFPHKSEFAEWFIYSWHLKIGTFLGENIFISGESLYYQHKKLSSISRWFQPWHTDHPQIWKPASPELYYALKWR